jgi:hypothetical protein
MRFQAEDIVGRYRLNVTDALLAFIERAFVEPAPESERARVRQAAVAEAVSAELVIDASGTLVSLAGNVELYRAALAIPDGPLEKIVFDKAPGQTVVLEMLDRDTLRATQTGKPTTSFRRVG